VRFLLKRTHELGGLPRQSLRALGLGTGDVVTGGPSLTLIEALRVLHRSACSALPIVDSPGSKVLLGSLSASDLRGLRPSTLASKLQVPVLEFLGEQRAFTVGAEDSLQSAMEVMVRNHVHRVHVVAGGTGELRGTVALTDVLRTFCIHASRQHHP